LRCAVGTRDNAVGECPLHLGTTTLREATNPSSKGRIICPAPPHRPADKMKVKITLLPTKKKTKTLALEKGATVESAIRKLDLYPDAWIAVRGNSPIPLDEPLNDRDEIKLIAVVSGG
jgi:sulfur carrier protein ThiS